MIREQRDALNYQEKRRGLGLRLTAGIRGLVNCPAKLLLLVPYVVLVGLTANFTVSRLDFSMLGGFGPYALTFFSSGLFLLALLGLLLLIAAVGTPLRSLHTSRALQRIGLVNRAGEAPILIADSRDETRPHLRSLLFDSNGIPLSEWQDNAERLESALNCIVGTIETGRVPRQIVVTVAPRGYTLPDKLLWRSEYLSGKDFILTLGKSVMGLVTVNLNKIPHLLIGGATGSGKTGAFKLLLAQCIQKGALVFVADLKGGADFPIIWDRRCQMCFDESKLLVILTRLVDELERRKKAFRAAGCANISEYNQGERSHYPRMVFACDEIAELLDKSGLPKEKKELVSQIESKLTTLARQGRAFGIHLILATQRPDANVLPGQIKNNIDFRVCGRADNVLSQIILDNTDAADKIPKSAQGRFLTNDGTLFQAYWFDESQL